MKGDFSRETFEPKKHYSRVLMQQGRVSLDSDFNEQMSIMLHTLRAMARDIFGPHGGPADNFTLKQNGNKLTITRGRYYVNGVLIENEADTSIDEHDIMVYTKDSVAEPEMRTWDELISKNKTFLLFLDVWERHITAREDPDIREVALGAAGPDTCTRAKVEWQVKALLNADLCTDANSLPTLTTGKMKAKAETPKGPPDACSLPPEARYRGQENQLYRVEIYRSGAAATATFKWSRENGSVVFAVRSPSPGPASSEYVAILEGLGRDSTRSLESGQWVELLDIDDLAPDAKPLMKVVKVEPDSMAVTLKGSTDLPGESRLIMRRWDQISDVVEDEQKSTEFGTITLIEGAWLSLENGVQVWFEEAAQNAHYYRSGDYWLIPARTATGTVEWPEDGKGSEKFVQAHGVTHHYAPLGIISVSGNNITHVIKCHCLAPLFTCSYSYGYGNEAIGPDF